MNSKIVPFAQQQKNTKSEKIVACPTCKKSVKWEQQNVFRPFCSKRCKLIDLGEWVSEEHSIPGENIMSSDEHSEQDY